MRWGCRSHAGSVHAPAAKNVSRHQGLFTRNRILHET
jgi:hypothetical protein